MLKLKPPQGGFLFGLNAMFPQTRLETSAF
jgi:hypothetical protein